MSWQGSSSGSGTLNISSLETSLSETFSESSESSLSGSSWSPPQKSIGGSKISSNNLNAGSTDSIATITLSSSSDSSCVKPSLLRKKSGDVVKSSLKLPALVRCQSTLNVLLKKSVSFALRLENIKMFDGKDSPSTVSTNENSPIGSPRGGRTTNKLRNSYFSWDWDSTPAVTGFTKDDDALSDGYDDELTDEEEIERKSWEISSTDIPSILPFRTQANSNKTVFLQSISVSPDKKSLFGFIMVKNIAFEKKLSVKLTTNGWKSSIIISNSTYVQSFRSSNYDQFKFSMPLSNYRTLINIELVIKYDIPNQTFWDNNDQKNYHITIKALPQVSSRKNSVPEFEDLVNRLVNMKRDKYENDDEDDNDRDEDKNILAITPRTKSAFSGRYNFMNEELPKRPVLKASYSNSDVNTVKPRYSNSFKSKQQNFTQTTSSLQQTQTFEPQQAPAQPTRPSLPHTNSGSSIYTSNSNANFNSKSYTDLLNSMCFYKGDTTLSKSTSSINCKEQNQAPVPMGSRISAASTFHSLSDSIHI